MRTASRILLLLVVFSLAAIPAFGAGNAKDLEGTPQAKAYRALIKAIDAQDFEAYKKCMVSEAAKDMDKQLKEMGKTPKEVMGFFKAMEPTDIKFTDLKVDGKKATLMATGKSDGEAEKGTIEMAEENGVWKVGKQSWTNAK